MTDLTRPLVIELAQPTPCKGDKVRLTKEGIVEDVIDGDCPVMLINGYRYTIRQNRYVVEILERADEPGYDRRTDQSADWHIEGRRNGGPGSDWTVNATHLPTGQSWLSLQAHSYGSGRAECVKAIKDQLERKRAGGVTP